jgi:chloramphenicol 3-O-phosphotransferase
LSGRGHLTGVVDDFPQAGSLALSIQKNAMSGLPSTIAACGEGKLSRLVIMTGASGSGKTAIAKAIERDHPSMTVFRFDTIGVPSPEAMATFGTGHQPGGAWQRAMTLEWFERIAQVVAPGKTVLFEGQMRIAFIQEAITAFAIKNARILCVECDDLTRTRRLTHDRLQPGLANKSMMEWSRYLHEETIEAGHQILDTTNLSLADSVAVVLKLLEESST